MWIYPAGIPSLEFRNLQTSSRSDPRLPRKKYAAAPITMAKKGPLQPASQRLLNPLWLQAARKALRPDGCITQGVDESRKGRGSQRCSS